jgi:hypothetical protein
MNNHEYISDMDRLSNPGLTLQDKIDEQAKVIALETMGEVLADLVKSPLGTSLPGDNT